MFGMSAACIDSESLGRQRWRLVNSTYEVETEGRWQRPHRGWFRRLAPPGDNEGTRLGSRESAELSARLALLTGLSASLDWLTDYWNLARAENKLVQYERAAQLGLSVPATALASRPEDLVGLRTPAVFKPLGIGSFSREGVAHAVHSREVELDDPVLSDLPSAPFIAQDLVDAERHLRVVTCVDESWTASLEADGLPLDWRTDRVAHESWKHCPEPDVERNALALARELHVGYSSQDWIVDRDGRAWFVDGNPAGQWLFLPEPIASSVTKRLATWLCGCQ